MRVSLKLVFLLFTGCRPAPAIVSPPPMAVTSPAAPSTVALAEGRRTFSFGPSEGPPAGCLASPRSSDVERRIQSLITATLIQKGYRLARDTGDIVVRVGAGRRRFEAHDSVDDDSLPDDVTTDFVDGCMVVDAFDGAKRVRVWHGTSTAQIDADHVDVELLKRSVRTTLSSFPPIPTPEE